MNNWERFCKNNHIADSLRDANLLVNNFMPKERSDNGRGWIENPDKSLILFGAAGLGKTYFIHALMKEIIMKYGIPTVRHFKSKNLDDRLLSDIREFGSAEYLLKQLKEVPFLFIDDLGVERSGERAEREFFDWLDERDAHRKITVISSNLSDEDILKTYGDRIHSRLSSFFEIEFKGEDIRKII